MNLTLYSVKAVIAIDSDGQRVFAKYYGPPGSPLAEMKGLDNLTEQRTFENGVWEKTKKPGGEILLYGRYIAVYKHMADVAVYVIGGTDENELMLQSALVAFCDALQLLLRNQVERRSVLENFDLVMLCLDETIDSGIILETDPACIASRVSRPRADVSEITINEQTIMNAYQTVKERMQQRIGQF